MNHFSKAASGFAHQQGGVLIWGISTKEDSDQEVSIATELNPINNVGKFCSALNSFIKAATNPYVDEIQHKVIYQNKDSDTGFVVSLFPRSDKVHMGFYGKTKYIFYKRLGDGFHPLPTNEVESLFFRTRSPDLELVVDKKSDSSLRFSLENNGMGIAKHCSLHIGIKRNSAIIGRWYDEQGNSFYKPTQAIGIFGRPDRKYARQIRYISGTVIHQGERISIAVCNIDSASLDVNIAYKIFAENMIPKKRERVWNADLSERIRLS